jgi:hypothetical protein
MLAALKADSSMATRSNDRVSWLAQANHTILLGLAQFKGGLLLKLRFQRQFMIGFALLFIASEKPLTLWKIFVNVKSL